MKLNTPGEGIEIKILGQGYFVPCESNDQKLLIDAAKFLNHELSNIQNANPALTTERCAVMVGLNLAVSHVSQSVSERELAQYSDRVKSLIEIMDGALQ